MMRAIQREAIAVDCLECGFVLSRTKYHHTARKRGGVGGITKAKPTLDEPDLCGAHYVVVPPLRVRARRDEHDNRIAELGRLMREKLDERREGQR